MRGIEILRTSHVRSSPKFAKNNALKGTKAIFSIRFSRMLDPLGYATFRRWRLYGQEALAGSEAALWLQENPSANT